MNKDYSRTGMFKVGFFVGLIVFSVLNVVAFFNSTCGHCVRFIGFPLPVYQWYLGNVNLNLETGTSTTDDWALFFPENIFLDTAIVFLASLGVGVVFEYIYERIISRRTEIPRI